MKEVKDIECRLPESSTDILFSTDLKHLKFKKNKKEFIVTLIDEDGFEILKGYGISPTEAINDLHSNLL